MRALALALVLSACVAGHAMAAGDEAPPDARLLLDLDILSQAEPRELMRRLSLVERLRLLELIRLLETRPVAPAERRTPTETEPR